MPHDAANAVTASAGSVDPRGDRCVGSGASPEDLATAFERAWRLLWYVAGAVLGDRDGIEDVLQDSVMVALRRLDEFDPDSCWEAWLSTIVRYTALNRARGLTRRRTHASDALDSLAGNDGGATAADGRGGGPADPRGGVRPDQVDLDDHMVRALGTLGETARACLLLHVLGGLPYREIARVLDIPEGTAMSHVSRARSRLRMTLAADGHDPVTAPPSGGGP